jgi:phage terminase large subunit
MVIADLYLRVLCQEEPVSGSSRSGVGLSDPDTAGARSHTVRVDSSQPETISYLNQHSYPNASAMEKWPDSVADGIARMRAFEQIVLHPSCEQSAQEFRLYSYKLDRLTRDVLPVVIDKFNHCIDSIR